MKTQYAALFPMILLFVAPRAYAGTTPQPIVFSGLVQMQKAKEAENVDAEKRNQMLQAVAAALMGAGGGKGGGGGASGAGGHGSAEDLTPLYGDETPSADPTCANPEDCVYPENHVFQYGGHGVGNIGNGLCTAKNADRAQVKNGYCNMLSDILRSETSCAGRAVREIFAAAGSSGSGVGDLLNYCPSYPQLVGTEQRIMFVQQLLAGLITKESGWQPRAAEKPWRRADGASMGGKGLFQIGVNDRDKDADCADINAASIFDPKTNIKCGACIALKNLAKDRTIGHGVGEDGARGLARYFGPFRDGQAAKRGQIASATKQYCEASTGGGNRQLAAVTSTGAAGAAGASN